MGCLFVLGLAALDFFEAVKVVTLRLRLCVTTLVRAPSALRAEALVECEGMKKRCAAETEVRKRPSDSLHGQRLLYVGCAATEETGVTKKSSD